MQIGATVQWKTGLIRSVCRKCDVPLFLGTVNKNKGAICYRCRMAALPERTCVDCGVRFQALNARRCPPCSRHRWQFMERERTAASSAVAKARRQGLLADPRTLACTDCGGNATEYDHRDYTKPLDVQPVCRSCNKRRGPGKRAVEYEPRA